MRGNIEILNLSQQKEEKTFFLYLGSLLCAFKLHRTTRERKQHFCNSLLLLPPTPQTLRYYPDNCCRELFSVHRK